MNCKKQKEHLFGNEIHGIIESVDKIIIQKKDWFYGKYGSQCTFSVPDVLSPDYGGEISKKSYQLSDFRKSKGNPGKLWKEAFWSLNFCLLTAGGVPVEVIRQYIETQGEKKN